MTPREREKIEAIRKEFIDIIGDNVCEYVKYSSITQKLWILAHKKEQEQDNIEKRKSDSYASSIKSSIECRPLNSDGIKDGNYNYIHVNKVIEIISQILKDGVLA